MDGTEKGEKDWYEYNFVMLSEDEDLDDGMSNTNFYGHDVDFLEVGTKLREDILQRLKRFEKKKVAVACFGKR